jgi:hypothetical protein
MKKVLVLLPIVAALAACGTTDAFKKQADEQNRMREKSAERVVDESPSFMTKLPISDSAVFSSGTASSFDYETALTKAKHAAYGKICMTAGGTVSQSTKVYKLDTADAYAERTEIAIQSKCKEIGIEGVKTQEKKIITEGNGKFRAYVLIALPTGDANIQKKSNEQKRLNEEVERNAKEAFKELNEPTSAKPGITLMPVDNAEYKARRDAALQKPGAVIGQTSIAN